MKETKDNFHFGRKDTNIWQYAAIGFVLDLILTMGVRLGFDRRKVMWFIDRLVTSLKMEAVTDFILFELDWSELSIMVNDFIIRDQEWLDVRVEGEVTGAVEEYLSTSNIEPVRIAETIITEKESNGTEAQNLLGGEMRATYDFVIQEELNEL